VGCRGIVTPVPEVAADAMRINAVRARQLRISRRNIELFHNSRNFIRLDPSFRVRPTKFQFTALITRAQLEARLARAGRAKTAGFFPAADRVSPDLSSPAARDSRDWSRHTDLACDWTGRAALVRAIGERANQPGE
jgi:hypothetical protein